MDIAHTTLYMHTWEDIMVFRGGGHLFSSTSRIRFSSPQKLSMNASVADHDIGCKRLSNETVEKPIYLRIWLGNGILDEGWELLSLPPLAVPWTGLFEELWCCLISPAAGATGIPPGIWGFPYNIGPLLQVTSTKMTNHLSQHWISTPFNRDFNSNPIINILISISVSDLLMLGKPKLLYFRRRYTQV